MKSYSYNLFPKPMVILAYLLIFLEISAIIFSIAALKIIVQPESFAAASAIFIICLIVISFRSKLIIDTKSGSVIKESVLLKMILSREKIKIPRNCIKILIRETVKKGTGYYRFVLPVNYIFKSYDMFFLTGSGLTRIINTDYKRALEIAGYFKSVLGFDHLFEK